MQKGKIEVEGNEIQYFYLRTGECETNAPYAPIEIIKFNFENEDSDKFENAWITYKGNKVIIDECALEIYKSLK